MSKSRCTVRTWACMYNTLGAITWSFVSAHGTRELAEHAIRKRNRTLLRPHPTIALCGYELAHWHADKQAWVRLLEVI